MLKYAFNVYIHTPGKAVNKNKMLHIHTNTNTHQTKQIIKQHIDTHAYKHTSDKADHKTAYTEQKKQ